MFAISLNISNFEEILSLSLEINPAIPMGRSIFDGRFKNPQNDYSPPDDSNPALSFFCATSSEKKACTNDPTIQ